MRDAALARCVSAADAIRVVVVDDSAVARAALSQVIGDDEAFRLVGAFDGARRAIEWLTRARADVILLDLEMPGLNGLEALPELLQVSRGARVLIVSSSAADGAVATMRALALGATDTLAKPGNGLSGDFARRLAEKVRRLGEIAPRPATVAVSPFLLRPAPSASIECVAIGASTGGLHALAAFFDALPAAFATPILVTQHLPAVFVPFFADQLSAMAGRPARVARQGVAIRPRDIIVAPGDAHLSCTRHGETARVDLPTHEVASRCRPSVDPMFDGAADCFGPSAIGIVLSGMGRDGAIGAEQIVKRGGSVLVQDDASSAVWGMPGSVARAGLASAVAPPEILAATLARLAT